MYAAYREEIVAGVDTADREEVDAEVYTADREEVVAGVDTADCEIERYRDREREGER